MNSTVNQKTRLDWTTISLHWGIAILTIALFFIGDWMVGLSYYDPWYYEGPRWHKGLGIMLFVAILLQGFWQFFRMPVISLLNPKSWQSRLSSLMHFALIIVIYGLVVTGYLIVTGKGQGITFFDLFSFPSLIELDEIAMQWVGDIHNYGATILMVLVGLHLFAALKHHFVDKDSILKRMLGH